MGKSDQIFKLGWGGDTTQNSKMFKKRILGRKGGEVLRTFQLRVSGKIFKLGWGHHTKFWGWVGGWVV